LQRRARADRHRRGDPQALQGFDARRGPQLAARALQPRPLLLRGRGSIRSSRRGRLHPPSRAAAAGVLPAARRNRPVTVIGSGAASGGAQLLPEVLAFSSSLPLDRQLLREDVIGSMAHLIMLSRTRLVPGDAAAAIRSELVRVLEEAPQLPEEEDVHMAVETLLARKLGETAGMLHTDREVVRKLLRFERLTANGLDTVGDRDFALDFAYAAARALLHASRVAADVIDFCTAEFGYLQLADEIAMGSSMMPQKRNPD